MIFDYTKHKVVGVAECNSYNEHACIKPIGFLSETWEFIPLSEQEIIDTFPSRGSIFAYNFKQKQSTRVGKGILIGVMPSNNDGKDAYVWDFNSGAPDEYFTVIKCLNTDIFSGTPDSIFEKIESKGWLNSSEKYYRFYDSKIYCIDPKDIKKRFIKVWDIEELNKENLQLYSTMDKMYYALLGNEINAPCSYIDVMPSYELDDWLINHFLVPEWQNVLKGEDLSNLEDSLRKIIFKCKWPKGVLVPRMTRALQSLESIVLSAEEIKKFKNFPGLQELIDKSISHYGTKLLELLDSTYSEELQRHRQILDQKIAEEEEITELKIQEIKNKIKDSSNDYEILVQKIENTRKSNEEISESLSKEIDSKKNELKLLEDSISKLKENKNKILDDFNVVKDILDMMHCNTGSSNSTNQVLSNLNYGCKIESISQENEPIKTEETFTKRLEFFLEQNNRSAEIAKRLSGYIIHYKTLLLPDSKILLSVLKATGNCNYIIQYVSPDWRSFDSLWANGLSDLVESCAENPDIIHYYVLQNSNLTYLPCILQPIVDMTLGLISNFPDSDKQFPDNLRIILTTTEEEGLPLASQIIKYFGCLKKESYVIEEGRENEIRNDTVPYRGYLTLKLIEERSFASSPRSEYQSYISDYED